MPFFLSFYYGQNVFCTFTSEIKDYYYYYYYYTVTHRRTDGGQGGQLTPPQFGQFVDMNSGRESTLFGQNTIHV